MYSTNLPLQELEALATDLRKRERELKNKQKTLEELDEELKR